MLADFTAPEISKKRIASNLLSITRGLEVPEEKNEADRTDCYTLVIVKVKIFFLLYLNHPALGMEVVVKSGIKTINMLTATGKEYQYTRFDT